MKNLIPFFVFLLILPSCRLYVPNLPTVHIPEKAHELHAAALIGSPMLSVNLAYNPTKNFGFVFASTIDKDIFSRTTHNYIEGGVAGYWHLTDDIAMSATPTVGIGSMNNPDFKDFNSVSGNVTSAKETRLGLLFNTEFRFSSDRDRYRNWKTSLAIRAVQSYFDARVIDGQGTPYNKLLNVQFIEPMVVTKRQVENIVFNTVVGYSTHIGTSDTRFYNALPYFFFGAGIDVIFDLARKEPTPKEDIR